MPPLLAEPQFDSTTTTNHTEDGNVVTISNGCSLLPQPQQQQPQQQPDDKDPAAPETEPTSTLDCTYEKQGNSHDKLQTKTNKNAKNDNTSQSSHHHHKTTTRPASSTTAKRRNSTTCSSSLKQQKQQPKEGTRMSKSNTTTQKRSTSKRPIRPPPPFSMIVLDPTVRQPGPLGNPPS